MNYNEWLTCNIGKIEIVVNHDFTLSHLKHGRVTRIGKAAEEYLKKHGKWDDFFSWTIKRLEEVGKWKHETPHFRYDCDGGCLRLSVNGVDVFVRNGIGDGNYPVYMINEKECDAMPPTFRHIGVHFGKCKLEVFDYDCDGGRVIGEMSANVESFGVLRDGEGALVILFK